MNGITNIYFVYYRKEDRLTSPDKILIAIRDIEHISDEYIRKDALDKWFILFLGIIIPLWFSVFTLFNSVWTIFNTGYVCVSVLLTIITLFFGIKKALNSKSYQLLRRLKNKQKKNLNIRQCLLLRKCLKMRGRRQYRY